MAAGSKEICNFKRTLMGHDENQRSRALDSLYDVRDSYNVVSEVDIRQVFLINMSLVDDLSQLLSLELVISFHTPGGHFEMLKTGFNPP
jgi:hypothetical protein